MPLCFKPVTDSCTYSSSHDSTYGYRAHIGTYNKRLRRVSSAGNISDTNDARTASYVYTGGDGVHGNGNRYSDAHGKCTRNEYGEADGDGNGCTCYRHGGTGDSDTNGNFDGDTRAVDRNHCASGNPNTGTLVDAGCNCCTGARRR